MSCPTNCDVIYCFAEFGCDEDIILPLSVSQEGNHTMRIERNGQIFYNTATQAADAETMTFKNVLNEDQAAIFTILQPDATPYEYTVDSVTYTKFKVIIKTVTDVTPAAEEEEVAFEPDCP